jgi:hypothetical protein
MRALVLEDEKPRCLPLHARGDEHRAGLGCSLHPGGDVRRVAEHLTAGLHDDRPGLETYSRRQLRRAFGDVPCVEVGKRSLDRKRGAHRALGVVLLRVRKAEQRHQPVAELLQHMAAEPGYRRRSFVEIGVDECAPVLSVELSGEAG